MFIVQNMLEASKVKDSKGLAVVEAEPRQCAHVPKKASEFDQQIPRSVIITHRRPTHSTMRKSHRTLTVKCHQKNN